MASAAGARGGNGRAGAAGYAGSAMAGGAGGARGSAMAGTGGVAGTGFEPTDCLPGGEAADEEVPSRVACPIPRTISPRKCACREPRPVTRATTCMPKTTWPTFTTVAFQDTADVVCAAGPPPPSTPGCAGDECCYVLVGGCPIGRPFMVDGHARLASPVERDDWRVVLAPNLAGLDAATRRALADAYCADGLAEHASVASFARFVLECLALGAPADLVHAAQQALSDEIEHAKLSFGLASAYSEQPLGPATLDMADALEARIDPVASALRAVREGCIAETVAAALIQNASQCAEDPVVKAVTTRVAEQELSHAVLAWRFVQWLIEREGPELADAVAREFADAHRHVGFGATTPLPGDAQAMRAHGYLGEQERRDIARQTLAQVILPCARALLGRDFANLDAAGVGPGCHPGAPCGPSGQSASGRSEPTATPFDAYSAGLSQGATPTSVRCC